VDGIVRVIHGYEDDLIVAGEFDHAGETMVNHIARRDGASWSSMGSGFSGGYAGYGVRALEVHEGQLSAGGFFTESGSVPISHIAVWNGKAWEPVGSWSDDTVYSLVHFDDVLVAGSVVWSEGTGSWGDLVLRWDGAAWESMGDGELIPPFPMPCVP
jgi:hypothetical protein